MISDDSLPEADAEFTPDVFDGTYLHMELALPKSGGEVEFGRRVVVKRLRDKDGLTIGTVNDNPILDTRVYEVNFLDGHRASLAENLYSQVKKILKGDDLVISLIIGRTVNNCRKTMRLS